MVKNRFNLVKRHQQKRMEILREQNPLFFSLPSPAMAATLRQQETPSHETSAFAAPAENYEPCDWDAGFGGFTSIDFCEIA
jgi:hypothetical protein